MFKLFETVFVKSCTITLSARFTYLCVRTIYLLSYSIKLKFKRRQLVTSSKILIILRSKESLERERRR